MVEASIVIDRIAAETILVPIIGTAPLIMNRFSEKAKQQMLDAMQGKKNPKTIRDPQADYLAAMYRIAREDGGPDGYGFPVTAFKAATVGAARFYGKSVRMTELRQFIFMRGVLTKAESQQLVEIHGEPRMREDYVTVGISGRDLRYRPEFPEWTATLRVTYVSSCLTRSSVLSLIDAGGMGVGVGEWRPEKRGEFGTYAIDRDREVEVLGS